MTTPCPVCRAGDLEVFFETFGAPVFCNVLAPTRERALAAPVGDIRLGFCRTCSMIHNVAFDPDVVRYAPDYEASLHFSPLFADYASELAQRLVQSFDLRNKTIVDVGCGQGEFLALLCEAGGNRGIGFDASHRPGGEHGGTVAGDGAIRFVHEDFSMARLDEPPDLVCCRHVLEHVADPVSFLGEVREAAAVGAAVFFEVPNAVFTLRDLGIWDVIYEHCSYFTQASLRRAFEEAGMHPTSIRSTYGDQFLCLEVAGSGEAAPLPPTSPDEIAQVAKIAELVGRFEAQFAAKLGRWNDALDGYASGGRQVVLWGAGSKGITFLNAVESGDRVAAVVDLNPRKHGRHVAGTGQVVEPPESLRGRAVDAVLVANPIYEGEIRQHCLQMGLSPELLVL